MLGIPPYERFSPDLNIYPQNFAIGQDRNGIVYVGSQAGLLEFDGERWNVLRLPNREIVRSLAVAPGGRVYIGGYNAFGYMQRSATGAPVFHDLTAKFRAQVGDREFADIWDTYVAPEGIYFRALRDLFFWDPVHDRTLFWHRDEKFGTIGRLDGRTIVQFRGEGFRQREGDQWLPLPGTSSLATFVFQLVPLRDGGLLALGSDGRWLKIRSGAVEPVKMPDGLPNSAHFEHAIAADDGSVALASGDGVVYLLPPGLGSERHFRVEGGFLSGLSTAFDGGILVAGDQAIYRIAWPSEWGILGSAEGADGSLYGVAEWNGNHYLMSSAGALKIAHGAGGQVTVEKQPWFDLQVHDLIGLGADHALFAADHKLMRLDSGRVSEVSAELIYPRMFQRSRFRTGRIYLATEAGLRVVEADHGRIALSPALAADGDVLVASIAERSANEVWIGTARHGCWRYLFNDDGTVASARRFGEVDGLHTDGVAETSVVVLGDGSLVCSTEQGFFRLAGERFEAVRMGGLEALRGPDEMLNLVPVPGGGDWAYSDTRLFRRLPSGFWREQDISKLRQGALQGHFLDAGGNVMFVSSQALILHDGSAPQPPASAAIPHVGLRSVTRILGDGRHVALALATAPRLPGSDEGLMVEFSLPDLSRNGGQRYRGQLSGYETSYSAWEKPHTYTYSHLPPGNYRLLVQAKDSRGRISTMTPFAFSIEPAWYETSLARGAAIALFGALVWLATFLFVRQRTRRLAGEKLQLEATIAARTHELADANRRLDMMAHLDGLTGIPNRRRLDEYLDVVWAQCMERVRPLSILAIDVDLFKEFNDSRGHLAGDELLKILADQLARCLRRSEDLLARYGGEEFLVVLPGAGVDVAADLAETMRKAVQDSACGVTISLGVAGRIPLPGSALMDLLADADKALYSAKSAGRNRVAVSELAVGHGDG